MWVCTARDETNIINIDVPLLRKGGTSKPFNPSLEIHSTYNFVSRASQNMYQALGDTEKQLCCRNSPLWPNVLHLPVLLRTPRNVNNEQHDKETHLATRRRACIHEAHQPVRWVDVLLTA